MYLYRAQMGLKDGPSGAVQDYLIKVLKIRERIDANYSTDVDEDVRNIIEAYASGINYWMIKNPENDFNHFFPVTEKDIVAGFAIQNLFSQELSVPLKSFKGKQTYKRNTLLYIKMSNSLQAQTY